MMPIENLTQEYLKSILHYDPETGLFTWIVNIGSTCWKGKLANYINNSGYVIIRINKRAFVAHRLAWLYMTGEWPKLHVDHINCIRHDNKWLNLREATRTENQRNRKVTSKSKSGMKGAYLINGKYKAYICLGTFNTPEEASAAYAEAAKLFHGEFANYEKNL